jgi:hypothetical protein
MARPGFNFRYQENYLSLAEQLVLVEECRKRFPTPLPRNKRSSGVKGGSYTVVFHGTPVTYQLEDWDTFPLLKQIIQRLGQDQDYGVVQYYPHGGIGIPAHRDKETTPGTPITGISLGWELTLEMTRHGVDPYRQLLASGSRYDIDFYAHAILAESPDVGERWSITARKSSS